MKSMCTLSDIEFMPIRELKGHIVLRGGDPSKCLEKKDLKKCLSLLVINGMSAAEVKECIILLSFNSPESVSQEILSQAAEETDVDKLRSSLKYLMFDSS